ncbi:uncharacterized protein LOC119670707 [Teleopsis dalmanni]|uniref:uncharacterized protein LOC119670707 n=1 Tax=Teleopsis dalmanni TaxID=139649 RepID=UPI0018CF2E08|nr:uncharacterized protein LOC119670707 [Teleopsis dalmanni]
MIIKAAADFISNQEQQQHHHHQQPTPMLTNTATIAPTVTTVDPLVNLLLNQHDVVTPTAVVAQATAVAAVNEVQSQFPLGIPPSVQQESPLIVALAAENAMQKSVATAAVTTNGAVVTQQTATTTVGVVTAAAPGAVPLPPPIPQELTTMSDQDLISFINPSTFDQI